MDHLLFIKLVILRSDAYGCELWFQKKMQKARNKLKTIEAYRQGSS